MIAKENSKPFTPLPAGSHIARCFGLISLGTQASPNFKPSSKMMLTFEVPGELVDNDEKTPMTISKEYTVSLSEKANLRKDLNSWRGRPFTKDELNGFAVEKVLGCACMLSVIHEESNKGSTYAKIVGISAVPKGVTVPAQHHKNVHFEIEMGRDSATFKALPEWIQRKITACEEWNTKTQVPSTPKAQPSDNDGGNVESDDVAF